MIKKKVRERNDMFYDRMRQLGYDDVTGFARSSAVDISFETCRRAINDNRHDIRYEYIVALMQALDFTPLEIAAELKKRGDKHIHKLIHDSKKGVVLNEQEKLIINKMRKDSSFTEIVKAFYNRDKIRNKVSK